MIDLQMTRHLLAGLAHAYVALALLGIAATEAACAWRGRRIEAAPSRPCDVAGHPSRAAGAAPRLERPGTEL